MGQVYKYKVIISLLSRLLTHAGLESGSTHLQTAYLAKTTMQVKNKLKMPTDTNLTWIVVANADVKEERDANRQRPSRNKILVWRGMGTLSPP